jgi:hypothetical protein
VAVEIIVEEKRGREKLKKINENRQNREWQKNRLCE